MKKLLIFGLASSLLGCSAQTDVEAAAQSGLEAVLMDKNEGCLTGPTEQFGRYLGDWNIEDWSNAGDGTDWKPGQGARWNFTCVGNGIAIQDFWMPNSGGFGTNLRMYDPKSEQWQVAWTASGSPGFTHISAKEDENGNIVMHYISPPQTPPRRITFFSPTDEGWNWMLELQIPVPGGEAGATQWRQVYKIKATKKVTE